jgi:predicted MFS family arabinose efflux permease
MTIYLVVAIAMLNQIGYSGSKVAVSLYALELGATALTVGTIVALYSLCPMLLAIVIGKYADRVPARLPMIFGCAVTVVALLLPFVYPTIPGLYVVALMAGTFHQFFGIPLEASVGGIDGPNHRARNYAVTTMGWSIATALGPFITGFAIDYLGYLRCFAILAAFSAAPVLILWARPRLLSKAAEHSEKRGHGRVMDLWRIPALRKTIIAGGIIGSAKDLFQFYLPIYGHGVGLSASAIGTILGMVAVASFVIRALIPFLIRKLSEAQILVYAVFISAFAYALLPFSVDPYVLAGIAFVLGLGVGSAEPLMLSLVYVLSPAGRTAEAIGLHKAIRHATQLVVPVVFGSVGVAFGYFTVFFSNTVMLIGGGFLLRKVGVPRSDGRKS